MVRFFIVVFEVCFVAHAAECFLINFCLNIKIFYRMCYEAFQGLQHKIGPCRIFADVCSGSRGKICWLRHVDKVVVASNGCFALSILRILDLIGIILQRFS